MSPEGALLCQASAGHLEALKRGAEQWAAERAQFVNEPPDGVLARVLRRQGA